jgi:hypothetical protein
VIEAVRDLIPQSVYGREDAPNRRLYFCRFQALAKLRFFIEFQVVMLLAGGVQKLIHELLDHELVLEPSPLQLFDLLDALEQFLSAFFETWIICFHGVLPPG